jgi:hypothetical protein
MAELLKMIDEADAMARDFRARGLQIDAAAARIRAKALRDAVETIRSNP